MDPAELKAFMDMHGYPFGLGLSPFGFPRYPPSAGVSHDKVPNPAKLKERILKDSPLFSVMLNDFGKRYLRHASDLLEINPMPFPPGHPMYHQRMDVTTLDENDKLKKENLELRKRIESMTKDKKGSD